MTFIQCTTYRKKGKHLTFDERLTLEKLIKANGVKRKADKLSKMAIARQMGISRATLYRELKRGQVTLLDGQLREYVSYSAEIAEMDHTLQSSKKGPDLKIAAHHDVAEYIENQIINEKRSPYDVAIRIRKKAFPITLSFKTIYNYIHQHVFLNLTQKDLPREGKNKRRGYHTVKRRRALPPGKSREYRPQAANERLELGHVEMDCVESGKGSRTTLLTMIDRLSRRLIIRKMPSQSQEAVVNVLNQLEEEMGTPAFQQNFKTITTDNGSEFLDFESIEQSHLIDEKRTQIFYCRPYASYERGSNEQIHTLIRRWIPKGTTIANFSHEQLEAIEAKINGYCRRIFDGECANDRHEQLLKQAS